MEFISSTMCMAKDIGIHNNLFGGIMLAWLDEAASVFVAQKIDTASIVTLKMSEVIFKKPVKVGHIVKIYGEVLNIGNTSISVKIEARRHKPNSGKQEVVTSVEMIFVRIDDDGEPTPISDKVRNRYNKKNNS